MIKKTNRNDISNFKTYLIHSFEQLTIILRYSVLKLFHFQIPDIITNQDNISDYLIFGVLKLLIE